MRLRDSISAASAIASREFTFVNFCLTFIRCLNTASISAGICDGCSHDNGSLLQYLTNSIIPGWTYPDVLPPAALMEISESSAALQISKNCYHHLTHSLQL